VLDDSSLSEEDGDSDSVRVETKSEPISNQGGFGIGPEPVLAFGEIGVELPLLFEDDVDDSFDRVADFEKEEVVQIPIFAVQPLTLKNPNLVRGKRENGSKSLLNEQTFLSFVSSKPCKLKPPLLPLNQNPPSQNPQSNL